MTPDMINGCFQFFGGVLLFRNSYLLLKHKKIRGVSMLPAIFFSVWGFWNLFYYPYLGQMISFYAGITVVTANTLWISLALYYRWAWKRRCRIANENLRKVILK